VPQADLMRWLALAILTTAIGLPAAAKIQPGVVYLGFLERGGPHATEFNYGMPPFPRARVVFQGENGEWRAIHEPARDQESLRKSPEWFPSPLRWTAVLDGRNLGQLTTSRPTEVDAYGSVGLQPITGSLVPGSVLAVSQLEPPYPSWPGMATYRPVVLVTGPFWTDPESWQPFKPSAAALDKDIRRFRELLKAGLPITYGEGAETGTVAFQCKDDSLKLRWAQRSGDGRTLYSVDLTRCKSPVDEEIDGSIAYTFLIDSDSISPLGSDLEFIDSADYDGDDSSEVLLGRSLHNHDTYFLFSRRFGKRCEFTWSYH